MPLPIIISIGSRALQAWVPKDLLETALNYPDIKIKLVNQYLINLVKRQLIRKT